MTRKEAIEVINNHLEHWKRLLREKICDETDGTETISAFKMAIKALEQESKTGHWKAKSFHELFCDNCGFDFDIMRNDFLDKMKYCPNCGAKMESEDKE